MYTYEERFNYELKKMSDRANQKKFFSGAINRMNMGTNVKAVTEQKDFACDVLCHSAFCLYVDCEVCVLENAFKCAVEEIEAGLRHPGDYRKRGCIRR